MSPRSLVLATTNPVNAAIGRIWLSVGTQLRDARQARRWSVRRLAAVAGVSVAVAYRAEVGSPTSVEALIRLAHALGLRLDFELADPRRRERHQGRQADPVHSAMAEFEAAHLRRLGYAVGLDEPYQHYQFAGRGDLVAWELEIPALLHIENRTRFPDFQEMAGSYNAKRAYLGAALAARLGIRHWTSEAHVIVALWSSEVLHDLRLRPESFRALCPGDPAAFAGWWAGRPPTTGVSSSLIVLDPLAAGRQRQFVGLAQSAGVRSRHRGYADVAAKLAA